MHIAGSSLTAGAMVPLASSTRSLDSVKVPTARWPQEGSIMNSRFRRARTAAGLSVCLASLQVLQCRQARQMSTLT